LVFGGLLLIGGLSVGFGFATVAHRFGCGSRPPRQAGAANEREGPQGGDVGCGPFDSKKNVGSPFLGRWQVSLEVFVVCAIFL